MSKPQIRVGIIGGGMIGKIHSLMLRRVADRTDASVRVVAIADRQATVAESLASRWPGARAVTTPEEVIADDSVDAVWICTPTAMHRAICIAAARAGKHIFCEKPVGMSVAEASEMAEAVKSAGVLCQVGLVLRFSPVYTVIRAMVSEHSAGPTMTVTVRDDQHFPTRGIHNTEWRNDPSLTAGGALIEHSVHDFDVLTWMFGPVSQVFCRTRNLKGAGAIEDFGVTQMQFAAGFHGQLTSVWHSMGGRPSNRRMEIFAENLFIGCEHDANGPIVVQRGDSESPEVVSEDEVMDRFAQIILARRPYLSPLQDSFAIPYALEDAAFVSAIRGECSVDPAFEEGVKVQRLVEAAYESARTGLLTVIR